MRRVDTDEITLAVIPARKGSKRLPRKNVLPLAGKPLIQWTIDEALKADRIDLVAVTSDDDEILDIVAQYSEVVAIQRPPELAADLSSSADVLAHALNHLSEIGVRAKKAVFLQPTSPLRKAEDIDGAIAAYEASSSVCLISVCQVGHPTAWCGALNSEGCLTGMDLSVARSQDAVEEYRINGAVYIVDCDSFKQEKKLIMNEPKAYVMSKECSVDIDELLDFKFCETLIEHYTSP